MSTRIAWLSDVIVLISSYRRRRRQNWFSLCDENQVLPSRKSRKSSHCVTGSRTKVFRRLRSNLITQTRVKDLTIKHLTRAIKVWPSRFSRTQSLTLKVNGMATQTKSKTKTKKTRTRSVLSRRPSETKRSLRSEHVVKSERRTPRVKFLLIRIRPINCIIGRWLNLISSQIRTSRSLTAQTTIAAARIQSRIELKADQKGNQTNRS